MTEQRRVRILFGGRRLPTARIVRLLGLWSDRPGIDLFFVAAAVAVHLYAVHRVGRADVLYSANHEQRIAVYAAGAGVMSLIAGFAGTAIAQYASSSGPIVMALRGAHGRAIRRNWISITGWLLVAAVLCIVSMTLDDGRRPAGSQWVFEVALAIAICKFARLLFLFWMILSAIDSEATYRPPSTPKWIPRSTGRDASEASRGPASSSSSDK